MLLCVACCISAIADNVDYNYIIDFREGADGWKVWNKNLGDLTNVWGLSKNYGLKGTAYVDSLQKGFPAESWCVSPFFSGLESAQKITIQFNHARRYGSQDQVAVMICNSNDSETWYEIYDINWPSGNDWTFVNSGEIDITKYAASDIQIAFAYNTLYNYSQVCTWEITDFTLNAIYGGDRILNYQITSDVEPYTAEVIYGDNYQQLTNVVIPDTIQIGDKIYTVTGIAQGAFKNCTKLQSITIPENVQTIGDVAFYACDNLTSVVWNAINCNCKDYYNGPFYSYNGSKVSSFTFGDKVQTIPAGLCSGLSLLDTIVIPESVTSIGKYAFRGTGITSITIPENVQTIGDEAFYECDNLTSVVWNAINCNCGDDGYNYYGPFYSDNGLKVSSFTFGDKVQTIPAGLCSGLSLLDTIVIPESVTSIGEYAFCKTGITSVNIPQDVVQIGYGAFAYTNLTSLTIPITVKYVGYNVVCGCADLTSFICHSEALDDYDDYYECAFGECASLENVVAPAAMFNGEVYLYEDEVDGSYYPSQIKHIKVIGGELNKHACALMRYNKMLETLDLSSAENATLPDNALGNLYNLKSLVLPTQLTYIPYMAMADCKSLTTISIPGSVGEIAASAFENCRLLNSIIFAESSDLTTIGNWAFYNCHELQNVTIPEGVTEIGHAAFYGCTYLTELTLPASLASIADNGFAGCEKLTKMNVNAVNPPQVDARTFESVDRSIPVVVPNESVAKYKAAPIWKEFNIRAKASTDVMNINSGENTIQKILRDGQVFIIRNGKTYTLMGTEI